jgi:DNA-binding TFAR19-related protein (PDSD5 family)
MEMMRDEMIGQILTADAKERCNFYILIKKKKQDLK